VSSTGDEDVAEGLSLLVEVTEVLVTQQIAFLTQWQADSVATQSIPEASQSDFSAIVERLRIYQQRLSEYRARQL
jgi:hypothetical protein